MQQNQGQTEGTTNKPNSRFDSNKGTREHGETTEAQFRMVGKEQQSFTDLEYSMRKRKTKREEFLETMDAITPWDEIVAMIKP